ncbi:MAG: Tex family protein [Clostridia bacterium]
MQNINEQLAREFGIKISQVNSTVELIDGGNTIPFIARYRKEVTGELSDEVLRDLFERLTYLRNLQAKKEEVIRLIEEQGNLTEELRNKIEKSVTLTEIEDIYRPFRPKKRTRATIAKEKGLEPLALCILAQKKEAKTLEEIAAEYINEEKEVCTAEDALAGASDIIAETVSDNAEYRKIVRRQTYMNGTIVSKAVKAEEKTVYEMYYSFSEAVNKIPSHRILAINRGEKEKILKVKIEADDIHINDLLKANVVIKDSPYKEILDLAIEDAYKRLIKTSIETEIRTDLTDRAEENAIKVFGVNIKHLLLQAPIKDMVVMGFDPAYRTGCKIAVIDETGKLLTFTTVYPTQPQNKVAEAKKELLALINKYHISMIAIGNGTASRESETFVADLIKEVKHEIYYAIVSEAGASVYSASKLATEEYPDINVSIRGAISIARRIQDPLAELVKIDPKSIGVGQYQHDVNQKRLDETLTGVVEDSVNAVGVDLNTATPSLLKYISGINKSIAENIVKYRDEIGKFKSRKELLKVAKLGKVAYTQCAGFLRIPEAKNMLDNTAVHPESYDIATEIMKLANNKVENLDVLNVNEIAEKINAGIPTIVDIIKEIKKPGRDPRDEMPKPILKSDVLKLEDLKEGMVLKGTVRNVVDFGAFVDIGIKGDGLVHISQISNKYIKNPLEVIAVGDIVNVKVIGIDKDKHKVSLSIKDAQ